MCSRELTEVSPGCNRSPPGLETISDVVLLATLLTELGERFSAHGAFDQLADIGCSRFTWRRRAGQGRRRREERLRREERCGTGLIRRREERERGVALVTGPVAVPERRLEEPGGIVGDTARFDRDLSRVELVRMGRASRADDETAPTTVMPPVQKRKVFVAPAARVGRVVGFPRRTERPSLQQRGRVEGSVRDCDFVGRDAELGSYLWREDEPRRARRRVERTRPARLETRAAAGRGNTRRVHRGPDGAGVVFVGSIDARVDELVLVCCCFGARVS